MYPKGDIHFGILLQDAHAKIKAVLATDLLTPQLKEKLEYAAGVVKLAEIQVNDKLLPLRILENERRKVKGRCIRKFPILDKWDASSGTFKPVSSGTPETDVRKLLVGQ